LGTPGLATAANVKQEKAKIDYVDVSDWYQVSTQDPADITDSIGEKWDLKRLMLRLDSGWDRLFIKVLTYGGYPQELAHNRGSFMVVSMDFDNDGVTDLTMSSEGAEALGERREWPRLKLAFNKTGSWESCRAWLGAGATDALGLSYEGTFDYEDWRNSTTVFMIERWRGGNSGSKCGFPMKKRVGVKVETWSQGRVVDQIPDSGKFISFSGNYYRGLKCNSQNLGIQRFNLASSKRN
jgi:hypothetical protein